MSPQLRIVSGRIANARSDVIAVPVYSEDGLRSGHARFAPTGDLRAKYVVEAAGPQLGDPWRMPEVDLEMALTAVLEMAKGVDAQSVAIPMLHPKRHPWDEKELLRTTLRTILDFDADFRVALVERTMPRAENLRRLLLAPARLGR